MAHYHSPTTFCEVTYDSDWLNFEDDRHLTPYRYSLMRNDTDTNSDTVSLTLPSYTYYEYLRSVYDCRTTPSRPPPGYTGHPGSHIGQQGRSITWHNFNKDTGSELSRQAVRSEPTRIRPTYPFPSLHLIQGGDSGDELDEAYVYSDRTKEKLVWVDSLNKWVPQKQLLPRPYMSFIGNAPVIEKQGTLQKECHGGGVDDAAAHTCERYEVHMRASVSQPPDKYASKEQNNEKREAIRRRAQEMAEQRRQRKAYSTPLYTSITERKKNLMKPRVQSSHARSSQPVSLIQPKEKMPAPKQVWQAEEVPKLQTIHEPKPRPVSPVKKEISITLMSPQPEDDEHELDNEKDEEFDNKKVTFNDEDKTPAKPNPEKINKEEDEDKGNNEEEMKLAEKQLRESLEKQKQLQKLEQQKLLAEEQRKEKERKEKERLAEEERLRKMKESHMHKPPLSTKSENHDNHYEQTMNAAAKRRKGKAVAKTRIQAAKLDKSPKKYKKLVVEKPAAKLPITKPSEIETVIKEIESVIEEIEPVVKDTEEEEVVKPQSAARDRRKGIIEQRAVVKKERRDARKCAKKVEEVENEELPEEENGPRKIKSWIYEAVDFSEKIVRERVTTPTDLQPSLSCDLTPELIEKQKIEKKELRRKAVLSSLISTDKASKLRIKPGHLDKSYADELRRLDLAEERRKKQMEMFERIKNRKTMFGDGMDDGTPRFDDYGFLSKYCIFTKGNIEMYKYSFVAVDETKAGWLEGEDVMIALRGVNNKLTEAEEEYLYRVLELTGYKLTHGADFKVFSVLAALSQRISALDKWMKNLIGQMDFKALEMKMFKCKALWECNVDKDTNRISIDQLCVDLRAGGVSFEHEMEVRVKLAHLPALDLLDFLTYIPLFIMIHEAVVQNPLDDTRTK